MWYGAGRRKIDRKIDSRERSCDHEDDEQNQHDIDKWRYVYFVGLVEIVFVVDICKSNAHELLRGTAHRSQCMRSRSRES